jgi:hypothetical protein
VPVLAKVCVKVCPGLIMLESNNVPTDPCSGRPEVTVCRLESSFVHLTALPDFTVIGDGSYGFEMLGDEAPFTMETRDVSDFPPAVAVVFVMALILFLLTI